MSLVDDNQSLQTQNGVQRPEGSCSSIFLWRRNVVFVVTENGLTVYIRFSRIAYILNHSFEAFVPHCIPLQCAEKLGDEL